MTCLFDICVERSGKATGSKAKTNRKRTSTSADTKGKQRKTDDGNDDAETIDIESIIDLSVPYLLLVA